jgi:hypothetical protein
MSCHASGCSRSEDSLADLLEVGDAPGPTRRHATLRPPAGMTQPGSPSRRGRWRQDPVAGSGVEALLDGICPNDPPPADQRRRQLTVPDRPPDRAVLAAGQLCDFLDREVRVHLSDALRILRLQNTWIAKGGFVLVPRPDGSACFDRGVVVADPSKGAARLGMAPRGLQAVNQVAQLSGDASRFLNRRAHRLGIRGRPASYRSNLPLHEPAERHTRRRRAQARANALQVWSSTWTRAIRLRGTTVEDRAGGPSPCSARSRLSL